MDALLQKRLTEYRDYKLKLLKPFYEELVSSLGENNNEENFIKLNSKFIKKIEELTLPGKNVRGALMVLGYELFGNKASEDVYKVSLLIELFHAGVLIHDDIMDKDDLRRGITTTHKYFEDFASSELTNNPKEYGTNMAINAGDLNLLYGLSLLAGTELDSKNLIETLKIYSHYTTRVVLGQTLDISNFGHNVTNTYVAEIHKYKTAEYTGVMPLLMGAKLAGVKDKGVLEALATYGECIGWAFQIQDDILGAFANEAELGKPVDSDIYEGKNTILFAQSLVLADEESKTFLFEKYGNPNIKPEDVLKIKEIFVRSGALEKSKQIGNDYVTKAKSKITTITTDVSYQELLHKLAEFMMDRNS